MNRAIKLNYKIRDLIKTAMGIAAVDGGFIIGLQIMTFLLNYVLLKFQPNPETLPFNLNKGTFLLFLITNINLTVIIYRIAGLTRGFKYNASTCYKQAFLKLPYLMMLYMFGLICIALLVAISILLFGNTFIAALSEYKNALTFIIFALTPCAIMICTFVVDQDKNPLQAIIATFNTVLNKVSFSLLVNLSIFYTLPLSLGILLINTRLSQYIGLMNEVWFLFCHIITIVIYTSINILNNQQSADKKPVKVIVI